MFLVAVWVLVMEWIFLNYLYVIVVVRRVIFEEGVGIFLLVLIVLSNRETVMDFWRGVVRGSNIRIVLFCFGCINWRRKWVRCLFEWLFLFCVVRYWKLSDVNIGIILSEIFFWSINAIFRWISTRGRSSWIRGIVFGLRGIRC